MSVIMLNRLYRIYLYVCKVLYIKVLQRKIFLFISLYVYLSGVYLSIEILNQTSRKAQILKR